MNVRPPYGYLQSRRELAKQLGKARDHSHRADRDAANHDDLFEVGPIRRDLDGAKPNRRVTQGGRHLELLEASEVVRKGRRSGSRRTDTIIRNDLHLERVAEQIRNGIWFSQHGGGRTR